ncbi:DJ-1/PfpI family protein [Candidatus Mycoplasma haematohominis]|uniref:Oxidative-stress-resistance chaperone n=1 Tax=Candidatus Mycoplasma haematohominis TaxID=1494318 RepID=A0A478FV87_9MOLU|nr:DJ-1/PfpI family protein [Candidatus Mycoplasma haemohominis]GCE63950.1 oxidative-stress-resistance chaperone [Candidatus Mycoplasma haemohominis]
MSFPDKQVRIAVICPNNVEDMELIIPVDIWRRAKFIVDVIVYDTKANFNLNYSNLKVFSNFAIKGTNLVQYDAIYLPGGPGYKSYLTPSNIEKEENESRLHTALKKFYDDETKWIAALCAAPVALLCILEDKASDLKFTSYNNPELIGEFQERWLNKKIVVDKQVITGQNAGCSMDIALSLVEALAGIELAKSIADKLFVEYPGMNSYKFLNK